MLAAIRLQLLRRIFYNDRLQESSNIYIPLTEMIENFWLDPEHQRAASWIKHGDINMVMPATSLLPDGLLPV